MEFKDAAEMARKTPGSVVRRSVDGGFEVVDEQGRPISGQSAADAKVAVDEDAKLKSRIAELKMELDKRDRSVQYLEQQLAIEKANLREYLERRFEAERSEHKKRESELLARVSKLQEDLGKASAQIQEKDDRIARVPDHVWDAIRSEEAAKRKEEHELLSNERRTVQCRCHGEIEECQWCDGRGFYEVDGYGNRV